MILKICEVADFREEYGILVLKDDELPIEQVQDKINTIKSDLIAEGNEEWQLADIEERLPKHWDAEILPMNGTLFV